MELSMMSLRQDVCRGFVNGIIETRKKSMTAPTTANEVFIRKIFDRFWDEVRFKNLSMDYRVKSLFETVEEELVLEFEGLLSASEIRDSVYDEGYKDGYEDGKSEECEHCSQ